MPQAGQLGAPARQEPARPGDTQREAARQAGDSPYAEQADWRAMFTPMYRALNGEDLRYTNVDQMWDDEDPEALDPWGDMLGDEAAVTTAEREATTSVQEAKQFIGPKGRLTFNLPEEPDKGRRSADRRAARMGVDPGRQTGGSGQLFDLARSQLGSPYVFGAAGPTAFDCSGFVTWAFSRAYGVALPHQALQQAQVTQRLTREELQPGDLIFYSYGRLGGAIDHVEIYMGNGKQIGTSNPTEDLDIDNVDWDNFVQGGRVQSGNIPANISAGASGATGAPDKMSKRPKAKVVKKPVMQDPAAVPASLAGDYGTASFSTVLAEVLMPEQETARVKYSTPGFSGPDGSIKRQLYQGFVDAGRMDLARMVRTRDFAAWIGAESGWNPGATSPANNHGMANDGLFQIWRGHSFNSSGQVAQMSPYEQAMMVAKHFALSPEDIRRYAEQIRSGSYSGWG